MTNRFNWETRPKALEANTKMLLDVERSENPVEIFIHVNMLKEGWNI